MSYSESAEITGAVRLVVGTVGDRDTALLACEIAKARAMERQADAAEAVAKILPVVVDADGLTVLASQSGTTFTNEGAGEATAAALPAATVGLHYQFYVMAAFEFRIDPNGTETIALPSSGAQSAAGKYIGADAVGEWVEIICVKAGQWERLGYAGTWTAQS